MGKKYFCKPCDREVGTKNTKPWRSILLNTFFSIASFIGLFIYFLNESGAGKVRLMQTPQDAPSDWLLLIPLGFFVHAIYLWVRGCKPKCPICLTLIDTTK